MYELYFTSEARKDFKKVNRSVIKNQIRALLEIIRQDPFASSPPYKKLKGVYYGTYSRRINLKDRLFYQVDEAGKRIKVLSMGSHYGDH